MQFSPNSEHILLAYGRRHGSLLKSIVSDGETTSHFFTVLEVNVLCFCSFGSLGQVVAILICTFSLSLDLQSFRHGTGENTT